MRPLDALRLARAGNAAMAGLGAVAGGVATGVSPVPWLPLALAAFAAALVASFGNILNDLFDRDLDRAAHPDRPLAAGRATARQAKALLLACAALGLACAFLAGGLPLLAFAAVNVWLLFSYERWLKARGLPGNALVAFLVASVFPFGAAATGLPPSAWGAAWLLAALAFLANLGRELLKDCEDLEADRGRRRTLPLAAGPRSAAVAALSSVALGDALAVAAVVRPPAGWWAGFPFLLAAAALVLAAGAAVGLRRPAPGQRLLKLGMAAALAAFLAGPLAGGLAA